LCPEGDGVKRPAKEKKKCLGRTSPKKDTGQVANIDKKKVKTSELVGDAWGRKKNFAAASGSPCGRKKRAGGKQKCWKNDLRRRFLDEIAPEKTRRKT